jgi:cytochrome c biogenesis protein CcdA
MDPLYIGAGTALWLGILTSISPCPLTTNIAAISYIGKQVERPRLVLLSGLSYTLGRTAAYAVLGALVVAGLLSIPGAARFLQKSTNQVLGPVLILAGLVLLGLIRLPVTGQFMGSKVQKLAERMSIGGAALLGVLFALSFCPVSAGLFFGSLIPLSATYRSTILLPSVYGIGTGLPVVLFAVLVGLGAHQVGKAFDMLKAFERWARRITGVIFILAGLYYCLTYLLQ